MIEQTASLSEVSESADDLASRATDLASLLDEFDLGGTTTTTVSVAGGSNNPAVADGSGRPTDRR